MAGLKETVHSMPEDAAKIPEIDAEVRQNNQNIEAPREHAGI